MESEIDALERRVRELELQILPESGMHDVPTGKSPVIDLYMDAHTMIQTALSCRDAITTVIKRAEVINTFLNPLALTDPVYLHSADGLDSEAKKRYALSLYDDVKKMSDILTSFKNAAKILDQDLTKVNACYDQVQEAYNVNAQLYEECKQLTQKVYDSIAAYTLVIKDISIVLAKLDQELTITEISLQKPVSVDD